MFKYNRLSANFTALLSTIIGSNSVATKYLIITVNRLNYMDNIVTEIRSLIPLEHANLQATLDHHGNAMHCSHFTIILLLLIAMERILLQW